MQERQQPPRPRSRLGKLWKDWFQPLLVAFLVIAPFRSAVADWNDVPTGSMKPTIMEGDRILVDRLAYDLKVPFTTWHLAEWAEPAPGDIVVCTSPHDGVRLVKRVIGVPGDTVEMARGDLRINGKTLSLAPAAADAAAWIPRGERSKHVFLRERLGSGDHTVMRTPGRFASRDFGPVVVPPGSYLVMGDNRDNSFDSRGFGFVPRESILGRATRVLTSFDPGAALIGPRWSRFFEPLE